jgi:hypothetical protein
VKCFWRKEALKRFLRSAGISGSFLAQLDLNESKRAWLDRLFPLLAEQEKGPYVMLGMAKELAAQTTFPDLNGWEDSELKIEAAKEAVAALAKALGAEDEKRAKERDAQDVRSKADEMRKAAVREQADLLSLKQKMDVLALSLGTQRGGYDFQDWFYNLLDYEDTPTSIWS